ncbi:MAG: hypothetical protein HOP13_06965 [Alphaproteobacteria bacterium]|nr:hypothetical protein [Alphaproteobacteria bacterium]
MRRLAVILPMLAIAGCQTMGLGGGETGEPAAVSVPAPTASPAPSIAPASNAGLAGMTSDALRAAWGEPSLKRAETGAEMWQYGGQGTCTLLVYFYASASSVMTVTHAEAVPGGSDETVVANCAKSAGKPPLKPIS